MPADYANTPQAQENRARKVAQLVAAARHLKLRPDALRIAGGPRTKVWKEAGLSRSPSPLTWAQVREALSADPPAQPEKVCYRHPDRPAHLYLGGLLCDEECAPWRAAGRQRVVPPPEHSLTALRDRRAAALANTKEKDQ